MESTSTSMYDRIAGVQAEIERACSRVGRSPETVTLVAVSKTHTAQEVADAISAGLHHFGENRLEEASEKIPAVADLTEQPVHWHMVGHIQGRKARYVTSGYALVHSLDSPKLAERLSRMMTERSESLDVLLEINVAGEMSKYGWQMAGWQNDAALRSNLWQDVRAILTLPGLNVRGLMTMAPIVAEAEATRPVFAALRDLRDALAMDFPSADWTELSMGMTDDYPVAIEEGATLVRIGRAIFGPRL
ncbi:MAG: YggS family pyridoxal phosphate-dependent enzyme [Anaerolineae bacterium]|nr:YggS family pyridoxal phosphate-dependent enzyme [Anaerolineae bacterium]